jgi:hypothetical protein
MPYKDPEQAKAKARKRMRRNRANKSQGERANIEGEHRENEQGVTGFVPDFLKEAAKDPVLTILNYGQPDCECQHCQTNRASGNRHTINHGVYKKAHELAPNELNRVALPGDPDYSHNIPQTHEDCAGATN